MYLNFAFFKYGDHYEDGGTMRGTYLRHALDKSPSNTCRRHPVNGMHKMMNLVKETTGKILRWKEHLKNFQMICTLTSRSKSCIYVSLAPRQGCSSATGQLCPKGRLLALCLIQGLRGTVSSIARLFSRIQSHI